MADFTFVCSECGARYGGHEAMYVCHACAQCQEPGGVTRGVLLAELADLPARWPKSGFHSSEALTAWLPLASPALLPPLEVGGTPLLSVPRLRSALRMPHLWVKDDSRNPSGSTKDRASLLVVAKAIEHARDTVACASTGNAAAALACVAASAGLRAVVFVPAGAPPAKLLQTASYGARLVLVDGSYDDAFELSMAACDRFGWYNRNTAYNPFTIEGKKTLALEVAAQLAPDVPDAVVVPVGDGVIVSGVAKGFADLVDAGLLPRMPRLVAVQPEGSAAIARSLRHGRPTITPVAGAHSVADSLVVGTPRNANLALREIRASGGGAVIVTDDAILAAVGRLAGLTGVFAEPAAAAALAGLEAAIAEGVIGPDERVVLLITGSGLKDVTATGRTFRLPPPIRPEIEAVEELFPTEG